MKYRDAFKKYLSDEFLRIRYELGYTQAQMAEYLHISVRSYASIESKHSLCGCITLIWLLVQYPMYRNRVLDGLAQTVQRLDNDYNI